LTLSLPEPALSMMPSPTSAMPRFTTPTISTRLPAPLANKVPPLLSVLLTIAVPPLAVSASALAPSEPALKVRVLELTISSNAPETSVSPFIASAVPLTVSISALTPEVTSFPGPLIVAPSSASVAALVVPLTTIVPALATVPSSVNAVPLVTSSIEPATVEPPLSTLLVLPFTVSITALLPTVCSLGQSFLRHSGPCACLPSELTSEMISWTDRLEELDNSRSTAPSGGPGTCRAPLG
jgi:hypothetical protein